MQANWPRAVFSGVLIIVIIIIVIKPADIYRRLMMFQTFSCKHDTAEAKFSFENLKLSFLSPASLPKYYDRS